MTVSIGSGYTNLTRWISNQMLGMVINKINVLNEQPGSKWLHRPNNNLNSFKLVGGLTMQWMHALVRMWGGDGLGAFVAGRDGAAAVVDEQAERERHVE
jgi:hypothetical protein